MTSTDIDIKMVETDVECFILSKLAKIHRDELAPHLEFDQQTAFSKAQAAAFNRDKLGFHSWLAFREGEPVGYFVGSVSEYMFSKDLRADQHIWYVIPEARASLVAKHMFSAFEDYARDVGAIEIIAGVEMEDVDQADRISKLFPRMGFKRTGATFNKLIGVK